MTLPNKITKKINDELFMSLNSILLEELQRNTPTASSDTANSWEIEKGEKLGEFILINPRGDIVHFLEEGTKAHVIKPVTKKMLKFELIDKETKQPKKPKFKNPKDEVLFNKNGKIFFYNRTGIPILGYVKEGSKYFCFAKKINHPGTEAKHFVRDTLNNEEMWKRIRKDVEDNI